MVVFSCSDTSEINEDFASQQIATELNLRNAEPCSPEGDCGDHITVQQIISSASLPCSVVINMNITICSVENGTTEYNFEEVSVTPVGTDCQLSLQDMEAAYGIFVDFYMQNVAIVGDCSIDLTTTSNYIKADCIELCFSFDSSGAITVSTPRCLSGAEGCCIERKEWCKNEGQVILIGALTTNIPGDCGPDASPTCFADGKCISRCEN